jgi:radical SAM protein with 4Fe4S-binding SPASM domain
MKKGLILLRTLTLRKAWNFLLLYTSFQWARMVRKPVHWGNPAKIGMEPTTSCNLRCPECPSGLRSFTRPTGMLDLASFQQVTDSLRHDLVYMLMYFQGEPYLNPQFLPMAAYAAKRNIYVATSTNAHYLTDQNAKATVESGLHEVVVSIDGATQDTYQQYRVGGNLEKVKEGTRRLVDWRNKLQSRTPYIILQFLVTAANEHEVDAIKILGKELGVDKVVFKTAQIYDFEDGSPLIPTNAQYSRYKRDASGKYVLKNKLKNQCWKLWMGAEITWDGRVLPCCFDKDAQYEMGKLPEKRFHEIWRGAAYDDFRGRLVKSRKSIDICTNCSEGTEIWA